MHNASVASVTIRDVPSETRDELAARARRRGQSLQEYLRTMLVESADGTDLQDWLAAVRRRVHDTGSHLGADDILRARDDEREDR